MSSRGWAVFRSRRPPTIAVAGVEGVRDTEVRITTKTVTRPKRAATTPPEWRRLCHVYRELVERSICGTATRKPGEDHTYDECTSRGHTICAVCAEIDGPESYMP